MIEDIVDEGMILLLSKQLLACGYSEDTARQVAKDVLPEVLEIMKLTVAATIRLTADEGVKLPLPSLN